MKKTGFLKKLGSLALASAVAAGCIAAPMPISAAEVQAAADTSSKVIAFPGAEGGGMYASGARGAFDAGENIEVYHVTNLNDSGEGSFRDAVSKGNRIVVFDVSGYIDLAANVDISKENITVLGQTAPGDGITLRSNNVKISGKNKIVRFLKFRVGAHDASGNDTRAQDGLEITDNAENIIVDHCSVSWGTDENFSAYAVKDVTIQNCIIAEALNQSVHDKGEHSYAAIWGGVNLSIHHNIIASHKSRNPKIGTSETVAMTAGYTDSQTLVDMKNNVFYNWGDKAGYGTENGAKTYIQNNVYKPGPATPAGKRARIFELSVGQKYQTNMLGSVYAVGNKIDVDASDSDYADAQAVNGDNWQDDRHTGVYVDNKFYSLADKSNMKIDTPNEAYQKYSDEYPVTLDDTESVFDEVIANAGATLPKRDKVDERIIGDVVNRTAPTGSKGSVGLLDDPTDGVPAADAANYDGRGYPIIEPETRPAGYDSDGDGIPDEWEDKMGLNKENPNDSTFVGPNGYTYIEIFADEGISYESGDIELSVDGSTATVKSPSGEPVDVYIGDKLVETVEFNVEVPKGCTVVTAGYNEDGTLKEMQHSIQSADGAPEYPVLTSGASQVKHFVWESLESMRPVEVLGGEKTLNLPPPNIGTYTVTAVGRESGSYSNMDYGVFKWERAPGAPMSGDFNAVVTIGRIVPNEKNAVGGLSFGVDGVPGQSFYLYYGTDANYNTVVRSGDTTVPFGKTKYLRAEREGASLKMYMSDSLLNWTEIASYEIPANAAISIVDEGGNYGRDANYAMEFGSSIILNKTEPKLTINNITENQRLGFNESIEISITPDNSAIKEIDVLFGGSVIETLNVNTMEAQTIDIPVSFESVAAGVLEVVCVDNNLCTGRDSRNVTVSADPSPWLLTDIGMPDDIAKTYAQVTNDFTYKMFCPAGGSIGGTADKFGYMYQQFEGDNRLYFRMRPQSSSQYGVVLRSDLEPDGIAYYFGCDDNSVYKYNLKARTTKGSEMQLVETPIESGADKRFLIIEKLGDKLNIYETNDSSPMYTQETLVASVDCSLLGDKYYMGIGVTGTAVGDFGDIGWTGIENLSTENGAAKTMWNFDNGLDWRWQLQEANVLTPVWTNEEVGGNATGKMKLVTDSNYDERYVLHEYTGGENMVVTGGADVLLSGDEVGMNVYLNDGEPDKAFKVSFTDEGTIALGDVDTGVAYETQKWYHISCVYDEGLANGKAAVTVTENGNIIASGDEVPLVNFRSQIDPKKKQHITHGIFFEAIGGKTANYYIDNVSVMQKESENKKIIKASHFWNFGTSAEFSGLTSLVSGQTYEGLKVVGGGVVEGGRNKTIDGISFPSRYKIGGPGSKTSKCVSFDVPEGTTDIVVYGEPAGSSNTRSVVINDGTEHKTVLSTQMSVKHTYSGAAATIYIYGDSGINLYGISYETY